VVEPFPTRRTLLGISKSQGSNLIASFTCGPAPTAKVLVETVSVHALPMVLLPDAVPPAAESVKVAESLLNATVVSILASPGLNTAPLENVND